MTRYTSNLNVPIPDFKEEPYDDTIVNGTFASFDAAIFANQNNVINNFATIGTVAAPGELRQNQGGAAGVLAFARGFASDNDGGGGYFIWVIGSTTDDGGTRIVPTGTPSGYWLRMFDNATYSVKWFGASSAQPNNAIQFNLAITAIGSNNAVLFVPKDPDEVWTDYDISTSVTTGANIIWQFAPGARINRGAATVLTISGSVKAEPKQIFDGTGTTVFSSGGEGWGDWWTEINDAVNSGLHLVRLSDKTYQPTVEIDIPDNVRLKGTMSGQMASGLTTVIKPTSAVHNAIRQHGTDSVSLEDFIIRMDNLSPVVTVGPATTISFAPTFDGGIITDSANGFGSLSDNTLIGISGSTGGLNDSTFHVTAASAGSLTVKGVPLVTESAGASITIKEGPTGLRIQGSKRGYYSNVDVVIDVGEHGVGGIYMTPKNASDFASYYNTFINCGSKAETDKKGIGICAGALPTRAVTNNTFLTCPSQAWGISWMMSGTGSGFQLVNCNGESPTQWGIYVTHVPSAVAPAVTVKNGEWASAGAGEIEALAMEDCTINGTIHENVTQINFGQYRNTFVRADFFQGEDSRYDYADGAIISPDSAFMRIKGTSGPITLDTTTPIAAGKKGQILGLIGDDNTNIATIKNSGNIQLSQDIWYGRLRAFLLLEYSTTDDKWNEISRSESNPIIVRTSNNAFMRFRTDETELTLSGASTSWTSSIPLGVEVVGVTTRVTEAITGAGVTGYDVGENADANHWGSITGITVGTQSKMSNFTDRTRYITTAIRDIIITAVGGTFTGGKIRISVFYWDLDPADG